MAILEIKKYPDPILKKKAAAVKDIDSYTDSLIKDMIETMYAAPGVGLAAPQIGVSLRIVVIDVSQRDGNHGLITLINPEIIQSEKDILWEEGCLSIPNFTANIKRKEKVVVKGYDRNLKEIEIEGEGILSIAIQHEIDHLNGLLLIDRLSPLKRGLFKKRFKKGKIG
jgi:peptide deformylase